MRKKWGAFHIFIFSPGFGRVTILDFDPDEDLLQIDRSLFGNVKAVLANTKDDRFGNAIITYDADDSITLLGVSKVDLNSMDFHLV